MELSEIIAGISCMIIAASLLVSLLEGRRLKKADITLKLGILERLKNEEMEFKKAYIDVSAVYSGEGKKNRLRICNKGKADAKNICFDIVHDADHEIELLIPKDFLPYPKLVPGQCIYIPYTTRSTKPYQWLMISWNDDYQQSRMKEIVISM